MKMRIMSKKTNVTNNNLYCKIIGSHSIISYAKCRCDNVVTLFFPCDNLLAILFHWVITL